MTRSALLGAVSGLLLLTVGRAAASQAPTGTMSGPTSGPNDYFATFNGSACPINSNANPTLTFSLDDSPITPLADPYGIDVAHITPGQPWSVVLELATPDDGPGTHHVTASCRSTPPDDTTAVVDLVYEPVTITFTGSRPTLGASPTSASSGQPITITDGGGCAPGQTVTLYDSAILNFLPLNPDTNASGRWGPVAAAAPYEASTFTMELRARCQDATAAWYYKPALLTVLGPTTSTVDPSEPPLTGTHATGELSVTNAIIHPGATVSLRGAGFIADNAVELQLDANPLTGTDVVEFDPVAADSDGSFDTTLALPHGLPPGAYSVEATQDLDAPQSASGTNTTVTASTRFLVVPATQVLGSHTTSSARLPATGDETSALVGLSAAMIASGALLVRRARRRLA